MQRIIASASLVLALFSFIVAAPAIAGDKSGNLRGASGHITTGKVEIVNKGGVIQVILADNFTFDGAPDPKLGFGNSGKYDLKTTFAPLKSLKGKQVYTLPSGIDPSKYNEFYVWCERFGVPLGVASIR